MTSRSVQSPRPKPAEPELVGHSTSLVENGSFATAVCTCGWRSYARRSRPLARREAQDHVTLHTATGDPDPSARR